ncbi:hypothetical protein ACLOJK_027194, partial [Asimina triloba]
MDVLAAADWERGAWLSTDDDGWWRAVMVGVIRGGRWLIRSGWRDGWLVCVLLVGFACLGVMELVDGSVVLAAGKCYS